MLTERLLTYIGKVMPKRESQTVVAGFIIVVCLFISVQLNAHPFLASPASPLNPAAAAADSAFYGHYPFIRFIDVQEDAALVRLSDEDFLDKAGKVVFKVNTYDVFTNDTLLRILENEVIPHINKDSLRLRRIIIRGAASPEGPVPNNRMLVRRRAEMLTSFLRERLSIPVDEQSLTTEAVTEDYNLLMVMMERAGDPALGIVRSLCEKHLPNDDYATLKRKLQQLQGGVLWRHLLKDYFPELRAARVVLVFNKTKEEVKPVVEEVQEVEEVEEVQEPQTPEFYQPFTYAVQEPLVVKVPRREVLSVKTNMLLYGFYLPGGYDRWCPIPNVAIEYYPLHGHFTYGTSLDFPWWKSYYEYKFFEVRNYQLEARYYFRSGDIDRNLPGEGAAFRGWYLQGYANAGLFDICFDKDHGYEGEYLGAGLGVGYVLPLTRKGHWKLEFSLQAGFVYGKHDPYQFENLINLDYHDKLYYYRWTGKPEDFKTRQYRFSWIGPTRVGITLTYDLLYLRWKKKGVSFRNYEKVVEK